MKNKIALALTIPFLLLALSGCADDLDVTPIQGGSISSEEEGGSGGFGMTYGGKPGFDMGGGFVMPFDGSAPGLGF